MTGAHAFLNLAKIQKNETLPPAKFWRNADLIEGLNESGLVDEGSLDQSTVATMHAQYRAHVQLGVLNVIQFIIVHKGVMTAIQSFSLTQDLSNHQYLVHSLHRKVELTRSKPPH